MRELRPLYLQLHTWVKYELAKKYHQPVPEAASRRTGSPTAGRRSGRASSADADLEPVFKGRSAEWVARTAEQYYTGLGLAPLPASLLDEVGPVPGAGRRSAQEEHPRLLLAHRPRTATSASLESVEPNKEWFQTAHHELGHGFYMFAYHRPEVPMLLRDSPSPALHEGFAILGELASEQTAYRQEVGLLPEGKEKDDITPLLRSALKSIPFMFFSSGTMTHFEADLYAKSLPAEEWNAQWWRYAAQFQGIDPPGPRGEEYCDAATKTHLNDTPAYYFSYAIATVFAYQLHDHIARAILKQDPRNCNYAGNKEVGAFLDGLQRYGATKDWRTLLREGTGEELSTRAMAEYYRPLLKWLEKQNRGRKIGWE